MKDSRFIEVLKAVREKENVKNPISSKPVYSNGYTFKKESIPVSDIKSFRPWDKTPDEEAYILGEMTKVVFKSKSASESEGRKSVPQMTILESYDSFSKRIGVITMPKNVEEEGS